MNRLLFYLLLLHLGLSGIGPCASAYAQQLPPQIGGAGRTSLALYSDGSLWGWGRQYTIDPNSRETRQFRPQLLPAPAAAAPGTTWASFGTASDHTLALRTDGTLWAWGSNSRGQLGDNTTTTRFTPVLITAPAGAAPGTRWTHTAPASQISFALRSDSTLWAWGDSGQGLLGNGSSAGGRYQLQPALVAVPAAYPRAHWAQVVTSDAHALALLGNGTLWTWGQNVFWQSGTQSREYYLTVPTLIPTPPNAAPGTRWTALAAGQNHSLALRSDGTLWTWGLNTYGQLGRGTIDPQPTFPYPQAVPQLVPVPATAAPGTTWQQVAAGLEHSLALLSDGTLWSWGHNTEAQLGLNTADNQPRPTQEFTRGRWSQIVGGEVHSLALERGSQRVFATGALERNDGQLGDGTINGSFYFRPVLAVALPTTAPVSQLLSAYPNPARTWVTLPGAPLGTPVQLRNGLGQTCRYTQVGPTGVDLRGLVSGHYWLTIQPPNALPRTVRLLLE